jgi:hypothetical protein
MNYSGGIITMRKLFKLALLLMAACNIFGCAHNYYNIPQETLEKQVKVVGVAPIFTDADSDIRHPEKDAVVRLIQASNAKNEKEFIARLRGTGIFYAVRPVDGEPTRLFSTLYSNRERRDDAGVIYNKYFFKKDEVKRLISENGLDAIMFITVSGITKPGKEYSSNFLSYLDTDFNYLIMTAQMLDRDGVTIWEYPNFRKRSLSYPPFFLLQYPDFDEATANLSEKVDVKFKTVPGVAAALAKTEASAANGPPVSTLYVKQYDEMLSLLKNGKPLFGAKKAEGGTIPAAARDAVPAVPAAPLAPEPALRTRPAPPAAAHPEKAPAVAPGDIVPEAPPEEIVPERPAK